MVRKLAVLVTVLVVFSPVIVSCGGESGSVEDFPSNDLTIIVPYAPGGGSDLMTRALAPYFEEELGQSVVVQNIDGASGTLGVNEMLSSPPDGHTISLVANGSGLITPTLEDVGYTPEDYATIGHIAGIPNILLVREDSPYETAEQLFAEAAENPGSITVGTSGRTTGQGLDLQVLNEATGADFEIVPLEAGTAMNSTLLAGDVDAIFQTEAPAIPPIESGDFRGLATSAPEPTQFLPNVPTFEQAGIETGIGPAFYGYVASDETPPEIVQQWEDALELVLKDPEVQQRFEEAVQVEPEFLNGEEFRQRIEETEDLYGPALEQEG